MWRNRVPRPEEIVSHRTFLVGGRSLLRASRKTVQLLRESARRSVTGSCSAQSSVTAASLRVTDEIQRNIESFFLEHGWFYDRRKNLPPQRQQPSADRGHPVAGAGRDDDGAKQARQLAGEALSPLKRDDEQ